MSAGAVIMGAGLTLTAAAPRMWIGYLASGAGPSIGVSCAYVPTLALVGGWFIRRRTTGAGLAAAGTGCGDVIDAAHSRVLIQTFGWREASTHYLPPVPWCYFCSAPVTPPARSLGWPTTVTAAPSYGRARFALPYASVGVGHDGPRHVDGVSAAIRTRHRRNPVAASALISIIGGMSVLGRAGIGVISRKVGSVPLYKISVLVMAASYLPFTGYAGRSRLLLRWGLATGYGLRWLRLY